MADLYPPQEPIGVVGAGAWGTALAQALALGGCTVHLWDRDEQVVTDLNRRHENRKRYPGFPLHENITGVADVLELPKACRQIVVAVPSDANTALAAQLSVGLEARHLLVLAAKGFRESDGALLSTVWQEAAPRLGQLAVLTGPTFARELLEKKITAAVVAAAEPAARAEVAAGYPAAFMRVYESDDIIGAQVGGAIKNILAIGAGILDGLGLGHNARAAMLTRGLVEMGRYSKVLGGKETTVWGLAGMGDLLLTATSTVSRNYRFGQLVGRGVPAAEARLRIGTVEGVLAARIVTVQAQAHGLDLAIVSAVDGILHGDVTPLRAIEYLMERPRAQEFPA
jgi:glycerol-3-phosphate dehydrogenase (NAD(P)+)